MLLSLLLNLTEAGCLRVFPRKYSPHYRHFSFLPPFGILYPHRDCNLISTKESILRHFPLQSTSTREGPNKKLGLQGQGRSEHQPLPGKQPRELREWQKNIFPGRLPACSPALPQAASPRGAARLSSAHRGHLAALPSQQLHQPAPIFNNNTDFYEVRFSSEEEIKPRSWVEAQQRYNLGFRRGAGYHRDQWRSLELAERQTPFPCTPFPDPPRAFTPIHAGSNGHLHT